MSRSRGEIKEKSTQIDWLGGISCSNLNHGDLLEIRLLLRAFNQSMTDSQKQRKIPNKKSKRKLTKKKFKVWSAKRKVTGSEAAPAAAGLR